MLLTDYCDRLQSEDLEERRLLSPVNWAFYESILSDLQDNSGYRVTYWDGILEIMAPSRRHELNAENIGRLLEAYLEYAEIEFWGLGSMTLRQPEKRGGTEPDKCYCLRSEKEFPDLAIEVIVTSGGLDKLNVYKTLAIPEVWFFQDDRLTIWRWCGANYEQCDRSELLPECDLAILASYVTRSPPLQALKAYRRSLRELS